MMKKRWKIVGGEGAFGRNPLTISRYFLGKGLWALSENSRWKTPRQGASFFFTGLTDNICAAVSSCWCFRLLVMPVSGLTALR